MAWRVYVIAYLEQLRLQHDIDPVSQVTSYYVELLNCKCARTHLVY